MSYSSRNIVFILSTSLYLTNVFPQQIKKKNTPKLSNLHTDSIFRVYLLFPSVYRCGTHGLRHYFSLFLKRKKRFSCFESTYVGIFRRDAFGGSFDFRNFFLLLTPNECKHLIKVFNFKFILTIALKKFSISWS